MDPLRRLRFLLVEDEELNRKLMRATLVRAKEERVRQGELLEAETLAAARHILAGAPVDLVLLDVRLPDGNGLDLARELAASDDPDRPKIVVLSASVRQTDRDQAETAGADAFLAKPYRPADLIALIEEITTPVT